MGKAGAVLSWLNGYYLGTGTSLDFGALRPRRDNVLSVLTLAMGREP
jgi:hypothetical protein